MVFFTHWFMRVMVAGKHQIQMAGDFLYLLQNGKRLPGQRHNMRSTHFCATPGVTYFVDRLTGGRDGPDFVSEIKLTSAGKTQLAGADKQMQSQLHCQLG